MPTSSAIDSITIREHQTLEAKSVPLLIAARNVNAASGSAEIAVGARGHANVLDTLCAGDFIAFNLPEGLFEVRLIAVRYSSYPYACADLEIARLRVLQSISLGASSASATIDNVPFSPQERQSIAESIGRVADKIGADESVSVQQAEALRLELDNLVQAANRVGRKDWILLAMGTLTNIAVTLALSPSAARLLFRLMNDALAWLTAGTRLLP